MRTVIKLSAIACMALVMATGWSSARAQNKKDNEKEAIRELVASRNYTFVAQTAMPMSGRIRQLNFDYDLRVTKDSLVAYLPYFGRAYAAPINPSDAAIEFTSKNFQYNEQQTKKNGWNIVIKPNDVHDIQLMRLSIFENGSASLQVTSNNRQAITFNGFITNKNDRK